MDSLVANPDPQGGNMDAGGTVILFFTADCVVYFAYQSHRRFSQLA